MDKMNSNVKSAVAHSGYYDRLWQRLGLKLDYTEANRAKFIVDNIRRYVGRNDLSILDFGCGRGWMAPFLALFGSVTGIDFSRSGIEFARINYGNYGVFILCDPESDTLGLPHDLQFDVIVSSEVIEHVPDHYAYLYQVYRFLKPDGWLMLTTPNGNVWQEFSAIPSYRSQLQPIENWLTTERLRRLFTEAGFKIHRHEGCPVYEFKKGIRGLLQGRIICKLFTLLKLEQLYYELILPTALYQMIVAQKAQL